MTHSAESLYQARLIRYLTAMDLGTPDRVPVRLFMQEAAARFLGVTNQRVSVDYNEAFRVTREAAEALNADAVMLNAIWSNYGVGKAASWRYLHVPGVDVGMEAVNQFSEPGEGEAFLREEEYDEFTDDPTAFLLNKWLPRACTRVKQQGEAVDLSHNHALMAGAMAYSEYMQAFGPAAAALRQAGIVSANAGMIKAPFDLLCDKFRGYLPVCIDWAERPRDVLKACEALMPHILENALAGADPERQVPVTLWAHRGCLPFITPEMFDRVYWPTLKPVIEELNARGHRVLFYGEGCWEPHYQRLLEIREGGLVYHLDRGDPELAARVLKGKFCLSGGFPYDLLARGTAEDCRRGARELLALAKGDGGYIFDASALMLSDVKPENLRAAVEEVLETGGYSRGHSAAGLLAPVKSDLDFPQAKNRAPGVCRSWEDESAEYKQLSGDIPTVRAQWQKADRAVYGYLWTTVLW